MADRWMIRARTYGNCNCSYACPCQFQAPSTHGNCKAVVGGIVDEGHFNGVDLSGLKWVFLLRFPGEVAEGNGSCQTMIDESATPEQREALEKIVGGECTQPGANMFNVLNSLMVDVKETLYVPITAEIDVDAREATVRVDGLVESTGSPIMNEFINEPHDIAIAISNGMEYETANIGRGRSKAAAGLEIELDDSYGQFCIYHYDQDGLIRGAKAA